MSLFRTTRFGAAAPPNRSFTRAWSSKSSSTAGLLETLSSQQSITSSSSTSSPSSSPSAASSAISLLERTQSPASARERQSATSIMNDATGRAWRGDMEMMQQRRFRAGDVYAPHDLTGAEMRKWRAKRRKPGADLFDQLGINPLTCYKNFSIMSEYMTEMGRIKHSNETGLRPVNQRKVAKAIRRAIGIGIMPSVHRHPELLAIRKRFRIFEQN
ncbi:ribosomal protein S18 [Patellaria atrata CBS 101060]|uniref:Small ribosomal subunit protein bS18m n=1 Tax=Patellaria atrata CBS 101060 TaxID=1346257 RepID=A0A9P4S4K8_9PEZI|nr:ribosomal protein S18 [Patellaria atrata CBS 101060]